MTWVFKLKILKFWVLTLVCRWPSAATAKKIERKSETGNEKENRSCPHLSLGHAEEESLKRKNEAFDRPWPHHSGSTVWTNSPTSPRHSSLILAPTSSSLPLPTGIILAMMRTWVGDTRQKLSVRSWPPAPSITLKRPSWSKTRVHNFPCRPVTTHLSKQIKEN